MEELIKKVNKLQDAFSTVGVSNPVDLPQIVVIGSQSSGKSSVLENIVGKDFLPRGSGIVTRRPLVLQLINKSVGSAATTPTSSKSPKGALSPTGSTTFAPGEEWGEFLHQPGQKFFNFADIRQEIVRDTEKITGKNAGISNIPIGLRIFSPNLLTLTLVDLPGLTKVPVGDQPPDIEKQIRDMISKFISKPNAIILAVTAANTDLANSDGLKLAREVDPEGIRTIGVLTKIDLMDQGTDVVDILAGRVVPLRLGYVPVVNRGQRDIEKGKEIVLALDAERQFFENHSSYKSKAQYCGTPFLARKLNMILMHHIRNTLPEIKAKISAAIEKYQDEVLKLGDPVVDGHQGNMILQIITEFCNDFRSVLEGSSNDLSSNELSGGARISFVFHELFANGVRGIDPFDQVKDVDIRTILYNSSGSAPSLFVGTAAFEVIVKQQIKRLEDPSLRCVSLTYDELVRILTQTLNSKSAFKRFPALKEKFYSIVNNFLRRALDPTNKMVRNIISAESCYINTGHPDFISGHRAMAIVTERLNPPVRASPQQAGPAQTPPAGRRAPGQVNDMNPTTDRSDPNFFESFFQGGKGTKKKVPTMMEAPPAQLRASGTLSEREFMETEVIKLLLSSYFNIVKRTVADLIPKSIMLHLVSTAKEDLQRELLRELYAKGEILEESMKESSITIERRDECRRMLEALAKADDIVAGV